MKTFKKLATLSMALLLAFGLGALTACNGEDSSSSSAAPSSTNSESSVAASTDSQEDSSVENADSSSEENKTYNYYEFTVLDAAGNKVGEGYNVQLCIVNENGSLGACLQPIAVVNGVCEYTFITTPGVYEAHVVTGSMDTGFSDEGLELKEVVRTSADGFGAYTLQLAE